MSKVPMKRVFICGLRKDRKRMLETLQRTGVVEISVEKPEDDYLETMDVIPQKAAFDKNANLAEAAINVLDEYAPDTEGGFLKSLEGPKDMDLDTYYAESVNSGAYMEAVSRILALQKQIAEDKAAIPKCETRIESLKPWMNFDLPLDFQGTKDAAAFVGSLPNQVSLEEIYQGFAEFAPSVDNIDASVISTSDEMTCIFAVCLKQDAEAVENALKQMNFAKAQLCSMVPREQVAELEQEIRDANADIEKCAEEIRGFANMREKIKFAADFFTMRADKYEVLSHLEQTRKTFFINGFVPSRYAGELEKKITENFDAVVEITEPAETDDVPVALSNGVLSDPMETVVESYSLPGKGEIDPSRIVACFYYIFFGMMLSDAGYGLLLCLGCGYVLLKVKNLKPGMKKMMKLFFYSGISTIFWGLMFGSFFGDAVNVIATTFLHRPDIKMTPLWFEPVSEPMRLLVFAFGFGIVHIFTGLFIKLYQLLKAGQVKDAIYDVVFWIMFVGGAIVYALTMPMITGMLNLSFTLGSTVATASAVIAIVGAIGVVLTGGRESKNWIKRLMKGAYSAYGVTSYLSDILSYSRLLALGLATGVIAQVFNKMGSMLGATWYGLLIFLAVFIVGHILNLGINVLGSYVHTNRLQFVEFFGKFYDGGGRPFEPFTENTKYYKVKEDK